jgi:hypothetical protein
MARTLAAFTHTRATGTGRSLDAPRFGAPLAQPLRIDADNMRAYVIGERRINEASMRLEKARQDAHRGGHGHRRDGAASAAKWPRMFA